VKALVGFRLLGAIAGGLGLWFLGLRAISLSQTTGFIKATSPTAASLAIAPPVFFYRGGPGGADVNSIENTSQAVRAELDDQLIPDPLQLGQADRCPGRTVPLLEAMPRWP